MSTAVARKRQAKAEDSQKRAALALKAYRMRLKGASWWDIAEECSVTEAAAAHLIDEQMREAVTLVGEAQRSKMLAMEIARLDALQAGIWQTAVNGDVQAIDRVLKIIAQRAKLLGLEDTTKQDVQINTVVISGNTDEYIRALQAYRHTGTLEIEA